jgi:hypothetical protein
MSYHPSLDREAFQITLDLLAEFPNHGGIRKAIPKFEKILQERKYSNATVNNVIWRLLNFAAPDPWDRGHLVEPSTKK